MVLRSSGKQSLLILVATLCVTTCGAIATGIHLIDEVAGITIMLIAAMIGFAAVGRLRCPNCSFRLSDKFPAGSLILLWLAREHCPRCGEEL
jgi:hypothetical protein